MCSRVRVSASASDGGGVFGAFEGYRDATDRGARSWVAGAVKLEELATKLVHAMPTAGPGAEVSFDLDGRFVEMTEVRSALSGGEGFVTVVLTERKADGE